MAPSDLSPHGDEGAWHTQWHTAALTHVGRDAALVTWPQEAS